MTVFADTSALVKLYAFEDDSDVVPEIEELVVSETARVEVPAALWLKQRTGHLSAQDARLLTAGFVEDYKARFGVVAIAGRLLERAAALVPVHALRGFDAIQLASALSARDADPGCSQFACFDDRLRDAAAAEGFAVLP